MISTERSMSDFCSFRFGGGTACITTSRPPCRSRPSVASLWIGDDGTIIATIAANAAAISPSRIRYFRRSLTVRAKISARSRSCFGRRPSRAVRAVGTRRAAVGGISSPGGARPLRLGSFRSVGRLVVRVGRRDVLVLVLVLLLDDAGDRAAGGSNHQTVGDLDLEHLAVDLRDDAVNAAGGDDLVARLEARDQF